MLPVVLATSEQRGTVCWHLQRQFLQQGTAVVPGFHS